MNIDLDQSLVSVYCKTKTSKKEVAEILDALSIVPTKLKVELKNAGVLIVHCPTIADILSQIEPILYSGYEEYVDSWPTIYAPHSKTVYVAGSWKDYKGNSIAYNVLNRLGYAIVRINECAPEGFSESVKKDYDQLPADLLPSNISDSAEFFASMFSVYLLRETGIQQHCWTEPVLSLYPGSRNTVEKFIQNYL